MGCFRLSRYLVLISGSGRSRGEFADVSSCFIELVQPKIADEVLVQKPKDRLKVLQALTLEPLKHVEHTQPPSDKVRMDTYGVAYVRVSTLPAGTVFRHFYGERYVDGENISGPDLRRHIEKTSRLVVGVTPYVKSDYPPRFYHEKFMDLTGVFFTLPGVNPESVGVFAGPWIDVTLLADIPVIELEPGRIYMVPGLPNDVVPVQIVGGSQ